MNGSFQSCLLELHVLPCCLLVRQQHPRLCGGQTAEQGGRTSPHASLKASSPPRGTIVCTCGIIAVMPRKLVKCVDFSPRNLFAAKMGAETPAPLALMQNHHKWRRWLAYLIETNFSKYGCHQQAQVLEHIARTTIQDARGLLKATFPAQRNAERVALAYTVNPLVL